MISLAFDGITSLSVKPIRIITSLGYLFPLSFLMIIWIIVSFFIGNTVQGWASTYALVSFIGGIQLVCTGGLGSILVKFI